MTRRKLDTVVTDLGVVHINLLKELNNIRTVKIIRLALKSQVWIYTLRIVIACNKFDITFSKRPRMFHCRKLQVFC